MPESELPKLKPHPFREPGGGARSPSSDEPIVPVPPYAELCVTSNYTFLTGASHPEEFIVQGAGLGYQAVAITDLHSIAGVVRAHVASKDTGLRFVLGTRLRLPDLPGCSICVYPTAMDSYRRLCRLLTTGKRRAPKGQCHLTLDDLAAHADGLLAILVPEGALDPAFEHHLHRLRAIFDDDRLSLAACMQYESDDADRLALLATLSTRTRTPLVATNNAHYHHPGRRMLHDILACIRHGCTLAQAGFRLCPSAERHLKPPEEMHRLFREHPAAIARTMQIVERTRGFDLGQLRYEYPDEIVPAGCSPQEHLSRIARAAADRLYPDLPDEEAQRKRRKVLDLITYELALIGELHYAPYFLTVHDLVRFARTGFERPEDDTSVKNWPGPILCQGRGAAANSAVCFCLGITSVNPTEINLLFERFISKERNEPPDIDIDFEHERREEVIQYIYRKYGRDRAALTAEVITYRRRSAVRDVGKALGLSLDLVDRLAKDIEWFDSGVLQPGRLKELGLNPDDPSLQWLARLVTDLLGFPRHLSQHVGGFVITRSPLCELVPVENAAMPDRTVIEWDKDDIDAVGMLKVDCLGLGMLTAIRRCLDLVNTKREATGDPPLSLATVPREDPATYEMIQHADTVGVFQIESRAQMSMLPRLKPATFYDLVIEVAIVRPGPIQGNMVHPYLRRRSGQEVVPELPDTVPKAVRDGIKEVLGKTLGVPLFQEQCMALAVKAAGFTPGQADQLRRAMAAWKRKGDQILRFGRMLISGMLANGLPQEFAERCFEQVKGFSAYGFPESHAASFALLVYVSAWLKKHHPAEFCAALLNSQPMGFYAPAQLIRDARQHGVHVLPVDIGLSGWDSSIQPGGMLRLGMRLVSGVGKPDADRLHTIVRSRGPFAAMLPLWRASGVSARTMRRLAAADAFGSMGLSRQQALWQARLLRDQPLPLFDQLDLQDASSAPHTRDALNADGLDKLPTLTPYRHVALDYDATGLSLRAHPVSFVRDRLREMGAVCCADLADPLRTPEGANISVAGLVLVRQRPGTANDVTFITLEDESGIANLIIWKRVYHKFRREAAARLILATGRVQRQGEVVHLTVTRIRAVEDAVPGLTVAARNFH